MSKATAYLVDEIHARDRIISSLMDQQAADRERCWDEGWHAHYLEGERYKTGERPFTKENPYSSNGGDHG